MNSNDWKHRLKAKVDGEGALPAPGVSWNAIEAGMAGIEHRRKAFKWVGVVAAAAAIAAVAFLLPWNGTSPTEMAPIIAESSSPTVEVVKEPEQVFPENDILAAAVNEKAGNLILVDREENVEAETESAMEAVTEAVIEEVEKNAEVETINESKEIVNQPDIHIATGNVFEENALCGELEMEERHKSRNDKLAIGIGSGLATVFNGNLDYVHPPQSDPIPGGSYNDPTNPSSPAKENICLGFPVSFGISARYSFNDNFFLTGGIYATRCYAESSLQQNKEQLWYLGPSAGLGVNLYKNANFAAYMAAIGNLDWCLSRRELPLLPSANLAAGVQVRLGGATWLYAEPQLRYTFKSENGTAKVAFLKPVQFAVNVGLRFEFPTTK